MPLHPRWLPVAASTLLLFAACNDRPGGPSPAPAPTPSPAFAITSIFPAEGFGGQRVLVAGTGFVAGATLIFGGLPAGGVSAGPALIVGTIPPNPGGPVDVVVTNPDGRSATRTEGFRYLTVSLTVSASAVRPGEPLSVSWAAPGRRPGDDWIGLFGVGVPSSFEEGMGQYTGSASETMTFTAPGRAGDYEFRYFPDDGYFDPSDGYLVVARAAVTVR